MTQTRTKIVATIGPACDSEDAIAHMLMHGLSVARINFSHGTHESNGRAVENARSASLRTGIPLAIMQDLCGPKIRTGDLETEMVTLTAGETLVLTTETCVGAKERMSVSYRGLARDVRLNDRLLLNDGRQRLRVREVNENDIVCTIEIGGDIRARRGVFAPDSSLSLPILTEKDIIDLTFGATFAPDFVALSFVQDADDITTLREALKKTGTSPAIIAKIETARGLANIESITAVADALMVARGDLAIEIGASHVPIAQKEIIRVANKAGKPVIVATQMLDSMVESSTPTRAETSDIANALFDGADAVMLSNETAVGAYPLVAVETMHEIITDTEMHGETFMHALETAPSSVTETIAHDACKTASRVGAKALVAITETGTTARALAQFKPALPIVALSPNAHTTQTLLLSYGVTPQTITLPSSHDALVALVREVVRTHAHLAFGDTFILVSGTLFGTPGETNTMTVLRV